MDLLKYFSCYETLVLIGTLMLLVKYYIHRKWSILRNLNIPHDPPSILQFGNLRQIMSNNMLDFEKKQKAKHGQIYGYYTFFTPRIICHDLDILQQVFIKEFSTFTNRLGAFSGINGEIISNSILESRDEQWKRIRKTMTPTFSSSKLKQMLGIIDWCVNNMTAVFEKKIEVENGVFIVKDMFSRLSLDVICSAAFSTRVNSQDDSKEEPRISINAKKLGKVGRSDPTILLSVLFPSLSGIFFRLSKRKRLLQYFYSVCDKIIQSRNETSPSSRVDLLQLMLNSKIDALELNQDSKKGMMDIEIIGSSIVMLLAGYESTGTVMTFLAYNLAQHPKIQRRLQAEVDEMYKTKGSLDYDAMNHLEYLDMCVKESIRVYTPFPVGGVRTSNKKITLNGLTILRNMLVVMPVYALCHDPEYWENPMEFNPERMSKSNLSEKHPMLFQPFGSGPRNCIGMRFALMEIKVAFCKLLHEFTFEPTPDTPKPPLELLSDAASINPKVNFNLRIVPRLNREDE